MPKIKSKHLHTIAVAAKQAAAVRDELIDGKTYRMEFAAMFRGQLMVGHPTPTTQTSNANPADLIAAVLAELGPRKRVQVVDALIRKLDRESIDVSARKQADRLIRGTARRKSTTNRGNVTGDIICELV